MDATKLKRRLLGYSRKGVRELIADRDVMLVRASRETRDAESRAAELAAELEQARREIVELTTRCNDLEARLQESAERFRAVERSESPSTTEGLTDILHSAERALARLTDAARRNAEQELGETERAREELREEIERLAAWRDRVLPLNEAILRSIAEARTATATLGERLSELAQASPPPLPQPSAEPSDVIRLEEAAEGAGADPAGARETPVAPSEREAAPRVWAPDGSGRPTTA